MRIPNQLQGDPLYRRKRSANTAHSKIDRGNRSGSSDPSWRRVVRLVVVLALVIVLMQQSAKPGVYQVFFPQTPQSVIEPARPTEAVDTLAASPAFDRQKADTTHLPSAKSGAPENDQSASAELSEQTRAFVTSRQSAELYQWLSDWASDSRSSITDLPDWASSDAGQVSLAQAIQRQLIREARDGTVWRAADTPALMASLALHRPSDPVFNKLQRERSPAEIAGVLPLLQQPNIHRGKSVIARGDVVRVERITAPQNDFGLEHYFNLWLMPKDASARPWLVIVANLPDEMSGLVCGAPSPMDANAWPVTSPYPLVNVRGEFVKRLSYQSASGAELTPVVVGHIESIQANGNKAITLPRLVVSGIGKSATKRNSVWLVFVLATVVGICFSAWVMWRTAKLNQQLRQKRQRNAITLEVAILVCLSLFIPNANSRADSVLDLMPGFDSAQLQSIVVSKDVESADTEKIVVDLSELVIDAQRLSQLIYRFSRLSDSVLRQRHAGSAHDENTRIGDAVFLDGRIVQSRTLAVPEPLSDVLDFSEIQIVELSTDSTTPVLVVMRSMKVAMQTGDRLSGSGALIGNSITDASGANVFVAGRLAWSPSRPPTASAAVLSSRGVDLSRLAEVAQRDRKPLGPEDSGVFFSLIGAARQVPKALDAKGIQTMRRKGVAATPVDLLQSPRDFTGQWISFKAETVRITRVVVESEQRQAEVGGLFYYQIDAIGDLGKVQLQIEVPDGEPVLMENRYPITIVTATLPQFLQDKEGDWVSTITAPIEVEGWFYRLWSYESDFMESRGGKQVAPLIVGSIILDRRARSADPIGVNLIGRIAAVGVIAGIVATILFGWFTRRGDRKSKRRRSSGLNPIP